VQPEQAHHPIENTLGSDGVFIVQRRRRCVLQGNGSSNGQPKIIGAWLYGPADRLKAH
jgi:hypothetical protein